MMLGGGGSSGVAAAAAGGSGGRDNQALGRMPQMMMPLPASISAGAGDDDEFPRRDERVPQWSQQETRDFIAIRAELERDFTVSKRNKTLWEAVSGRMKELGYRRTADQCKCKWKNLINRYKGKETSEPDAGRKCPFFEELHAVFTEREKNMQQMLLDSETGSIHAKKKVKRISGDQSPEYLTDFEDEEEEESESQRFASTISPRKRKGENEKQQKRSEKASGQLNIGNMKNSGNSVRGIQDMLKDFLQQQERMEIMWRESLERHAYERQMFEQEWRQSMEKIERERLMVEHSWREREEQRRIREESRAEKRDALLTTLLNKLIHETHP